MTFLKRIWINKRPILQKALKYEGFLFTLWGCISLFNPLEGFPNASWFCNLLLGCSVALLVFLMCAIYATIRCLLSKTECILHSNSGRDVYVQYGDILKPETIVGKSNDRINIVIPVNRCFDTIVDDNLISHTTLHGKILQKIYDSGLYTQKTLNEEIKKSLTNYPVEEELTKEEKPCGNLRRYAEGTVAELKESEKLTYFFWGLSKFDHMLKASTTKTEYATAIQKLIEFCNSRSQGYPVIMPVIGSGLSRTNVKKEDILRYLKSAFTLNRDIINCDFHIVVREEDKNSLSIKSL